MLKMEKCDIERDRFGWFGCVTSVNWPISNLIIELLRR